MDYEKLRPLIKELADAIGATASAPKVVAARQKFMDAGYNVSVELTVKLAIKENPEKLFDNKFLRDLEIDPEDEN